MLADSTQPGIVNSCLLVSWVLPSPSLGDGLSTGPMALWIENSEMAAVVVVVFIYNGADLEGTPSTN